MEWLDIFSAMMALTLLAHVSLAQNSDQDYLDAHNVARAEVGVKPITWNETLAAYARDYANRRVADCNMVPSEGPYGENLGGGYEANSGVDAVQTWVSEKPYYDYKSNSCKGGGCRRYTQVVWRDSIHLGCARVQCQSGWPFVFCEYYPPGNVEGQRPY